MMIPVFRPHIDAETIKSAVDSLHLGWLGMGSYVGEFETELAKLLRLEEEQEVVAVNTGTSALHLALLSAGVGPGDEAITSSLNNIGDFQAIGMCGAKPVFVDILDDNFAINPTLIQNAIGPRTKAIIALHYMGVPCRIDEVCKIARAHGIPVIEDAAHATGTFLGSRAIGTIGDFGCFSFDAIKTVTCIDGGAVVLPKERAKELYARRLLGMTQSNERLYSNSRAYQFDVVAQGFRYHLANLHAAIGLTQLRDLPTFIANRRKYGRIYNEALRDVDGIITPKSDFDDVSLFHYVVRVMDGRRDEFRQHLKERGVDTGVHWLPGHWFTWLKSCRGADALPVTDRIGGEIVTLPLWSSMDEGSLATIIDAVRDFENRPSVLPPMRPERPVECLRAMKTGKGSINSIEIPGYPGVVLRPINASEPSVNDIKLLTEWRNRDVKSFLTEFNATPERTRAWLTEAIQKDDSRILFMIEDARAGTALGYIGLAFIDWERGLAEPDSVVRGQTGQPGLMSAAMHSLLDWARHELGLLEFSLRVLRDNPALRFYKRFGFQEVKRVPLVCEQTADGCMWREGQPLSNDESVRELVYLTLPDNKKVAAIS